MWNASPAGADTVVAQAGPAASPAPAKPAAPSPPPAASPSPSPSPPPHLLQVSGYADAGYTSASEASAATNPGGSTITGRVFDTLNNQIQFHNFNLQAAYNGPIGGKIEASFGDDANVINSYPKSEFAPGTEIDITQAYLQLMSGQFTFIAGKFETLAGAEVIESPNDLNFSRSILFGYAVPFTHTGFRLTWAMNSNLSFIAGINHGWDMVGAYANILNPLPDTNGYTAEAGVAWNPSKAFSATLQGYTGQVDVGSPFPTYNVALPPVAYFLGTPLTSCAFPAAYPTQVACGAYAVGVSTNPSRPQKSLVDTVLTLHATSALTFTLNGDYGAQTNSNLYSNTGALTGYGYGSWSGLAGYANYALSGQWSATIRGEYMGDFGGLRTGISQRWAEVTGTVQYAPNSNIIVRGEIRGDRSNQMFFAGANGALYYTNAQFGIETILKWP